jgi:hypothetical protein
VGSCFLTISLPRPLAGMRYLISNVGPGGQANFHVDASRYDGANLWLRGYGGKLANSGDYPGL